MNCEKTKQIAEYAVDLIVSDISDRSGIGNEWEVIDEDIQEEIKKYWRTIIIAALNEIWIDHEKEFIDPVWKSLVNIRIITIRW